MALTSLAGSFHSPRETPARARTRVLGALVSRWPRVAPRLPGRCRARGAENEMALRRWPASRDYCLHRLGTPPGIAAQRQTIDTGPNRRGYRVHPAVGDWARIT